MRNTRSSGHFGPITSQNRHFTLRFNQFYVSSLRVPESKPEMGHARDLLSTREFELAWRDAQMIEEPDATTQEDGNEVNADLVQQTRLDELLGNVRAGDADILVAGGRLHLGKRALDPIVDEDERGLLLRDRLPHLMREPVTKTGQVNW
jgi:hypothetical protein